MCEVVKQKQNLIHEAACYAEFVLTPMMSWHYCSWLRNKRLVDFLLHAVFITAA